MQHNDNHPSVLLDRVNALIKQKLHDHAPVVGAFAEQLYRNMAQDDLIGRNDSNLYGAMLSVWNLLNERKPDKTLVRVFNPNLSRHGWQSTHTVVEIIVRDMPFLVDSVRMALKRLNLTSHLLIHHPLSINRAKKAHNGIHPITDIKPGNQPSMHEQVTVFLIEIDRLTDGDLIDEVASELHGVINNVRAAVSDWQPMREKLQQLVRQLVDQPLPAEITDEQRRETQEFLNWLVNDNFTLMGYREYRLQPISGDFELQPVDDSSLGLMRASVGQKARRLSELPDSARKEALRPALLVLTKSNATSLIHRNGHIDYVGIKIFDKKGNVVGEHRFIGLFAASFYNSSAMDIPLLSNKIRRVLALAGFSQISHAHKALHNLLETYPRDELLQASEQQLCEILLGVLQMQEREITRLFVRKDVFGRFFSCMVYVPRERYNTLLRQATQSILARVLGSQEEVEFTTWFSEAGHARTQYFVRVENNNQDVDVKYIEQNLIEATRSWEDKLAQALFSTFGEEKGKRLHYRFSQAFPSSYQEDILPTTAVADIEQLRRLNDQHKLGMLLFQPQESRLESNHVRLKLFHREQPIHLSDVLPMLENFGLRVINERPYQLTAEDGEVYWILDFGMIHQRHTLDLESCQERFQQAFSAVWQGELEDDGFNRLVLGAGLSGREASLLRAYARYMRQIGSSFSQTYIEQTLEDFPEISALLFKLFNRKFNPDLKPSQLAVDRLQQEIIGKLEQVESLDDDRIIRRYLELIEATVRTNYFQTAQPEATEPGAEKSYISFKLEPQRLTEMPRPVPRHEIFVYSPRVEGVHLRGGKVARGGLRWSDRREDYRTEVLGLVKAQQVKNTVIVPVGAKGGFVCKHQTTQMSRDQLQAEGQACYRLFIRGLLDVTDNIQQNTVVPPAQVVRHDDDDSYLVVAADKGTATFSDIANGIAEEYGFWLGDAFASGGSVGYDHKKMGITARGAWESVKRHFREMGIDCQQELFTCIGIGDMSGDVFGNGMLLSDKTRLVAAFNHLHIFIDPDPDAASSYAERQRLFALPRSGWDDYDQSLISEGGGIFTRRTKSITLTPQIKKLLGTQKQHMAPNELIQALLRSEVDLLWNGGIGTYVKSSRESDIDVGDRNNDAVRINGSELRARIVGEGGNLGLTQLGRIEYAAQGGRINTDFIDNAGGVDCSDTEVNIKILLNHQVQEGNLTRKQRDKLLIAMTDHVARLVLEDCYQQTSSLSVSELNSHQQLKEHARFMQEFERTGKLDRQLEFLPTDEELVERHGNGQGLTRPELSVLTAYAKMDLKERLLEEPVIDTPWHEHQLLLSAPEKLRAKFRQGILEHPLRRELISTGLANQVVNEMGINFVSRLQDETGAGLSDVIYSYTLAREIFDIEQIFGQIMALDNQVASRVQADMLHHIRRQMRRASRWLLQNTPQQSAIAEAAEPYRQAVSVLNENVMQMMTQEEADSLRESASALSEQAVPEELARYISNFSTLFSVLDIVQLSQQTARPLTEISELYFKLGAGLELHWLLRQVNRQPVANHWQAMARSAFREELDSKQRELTAIVIATRQADSEAELSAEQLLEAWQQRFSSELERWHHMLADFKSGTSHEAAKFSVAMRELSLLCHRCQAST